MSEAIQDIFTPETSEKELESKESPEKEETSSLVGLNRDEKQLRREYEKIDELVQELRSDIEKRFQTYPSMDERTNVLDVSNVHTKQFLNEVIDVAQENEVPVTVLVTDFDGFKRVNDTYSHAIGDACIDSFALSLSKRLRATDIATGFSREDVENIPEEASNIKGVPARLGGDDYTMVLPGARVEDVPLIVGDVSDIWVEKLRYIEDLFGSAEFNPEKQGLKEELQENLGPSWTVERVLTTRKKLESDGKSINRGDISDKLFFSVGAVQAKDGEGFEELSNRAEQSLSKAKGKNVVGLQKSMKSFKSMVTGKEEASNRIVMEGGEAVDIRKGYKAPPRTSIF